MPGSMMSSTIDVVAALAGAPEGVDAVPGHVDGHALGLEAHAEALGQGRLVLDDEHAHGRPPPRAPCPPVPILARPR